MRRWHCVCGNELFYENSLCLQCGLEAGYCSECRGLTGLQPTSETEVYRCGNCRARLAKCTNYSEHGVCNRCVHAENRPSKGVLCNCCRFNRTIPDLSLPGHRAQWYRLECAKRRLFYTLDLLDLPYGNESNGFDPPLSFCFMADRVPADGVWHSVTETERVYTGHARGQITINLREADDVEREKMRVEFGEAHRTLNGHFRHEIGHYYWDALVAGHREESFRTTFGDHSQNYQDALERYYREGPRGGWNREFVSAYASVHPWEDFAETFEAYLGMVETLDTAHHWNLGRTPPVIGTPIGELVASYHQLGIAINELNRGMGLADLVPAVLVGPIVSKLQWIHSLVRSSGRVPIPMIV